MRGLFILLIIATQTQAQVMTLSTANISVAVDVSTGARIISLQVDGHEVLGSSKIHPHFYGSSLWLSPEGKWKGMGALDAGPYTVTRSTADALILQSPADTVRGFSFIKEIHINSADTSVSLTYTITNTAATPQELAPWEVTRVPTGGLAFFPAGSSPALPKSDLNVHDSAGFAWYPYDTSTHVRQKLYRRGAEGWTGYVRNGILFVKSYPIIDGPAPAEENVEIYVNPERTYIELENQGPYQRLEPGGSLTYSVKWYPRRLSSGADPVATARRLGHH